MTLRETPAIDVVAPADGTILTPAALEFVARLHRELNPTRLALLDRQRERQRAKELFAEVALAAEFVEFLTLPAYDRLGRPAPAGRRRVVTSVMPKL
jgi:hypothetical protein